MAVKSHASFNVSLIRYVQEQRAPNEELNLLVKGDAGAISKARGIIKYTVGNISAVRIKASQLNMLLHSQGIQRVEGYSGTGMTLDEQSDINTRADSVKQGFSPLTRGYDGKGVVVGVIDAGIDFNHADFKDSTGKTRIKYLWDQLAVSGGNATSFGYGRDWAAADIDGGNCTHAEQSQYFGHGTNVTGAAAGNGLALNKYAGIATRADIISVSCNLSANFLNNFVDAVKYIYDKADQLGKPCVINASVGTYFGSHDGSDLASQVIDSLISAQKGRALVAAAGDAGNGGDVPATLIHLGYNVEADSAFTWFKNIPSANVVFFEIWARKTQFNNVDFQLGVDLPAGGGFKKRAHTSYFNILNDFDLSNGADSLRDTLYANTHRLGIISVYASVYNDSLYDIAVLIHPDTLNNLWRFTTKGSGYFDCWSNGLFGSSTIKANGLPISSFYPDIDRYRFPDSTQSLVSSFQCSDYVLTVADYYNRNSYVDYDGTDTTFLNITVGARSGSSSIGPTRDGRIKPDISAPGSNTMASGNASVITQLIGSGQSWKVAQGGKHNINGGTSLASPIVTGIVALYLQKNPTASWSDIKYAIKTTAIQDAFTGNALPDNKWGYGKINAFAALKLNNVNTNDISTVNEGDFFVFPNPAANTVYFQYQLSGTRGKNFIQIADISGRLLDNISLNTASGSLQYDVSHLADGIYFCRLQSEGKVVQVVKLVKM